MKLVYFLVRWWGVIRGWPIGLIFFKPKIYYENKDVQSSRIKGGHLIISNHFGPFDYMVSLLILLPRFLRVVSAEFPYRNKFLAFGMHSWRAIKVDRSVNSMRFIDESVSAIRNGDMVQIFPEAHDSPDGNIHPFKPSYIMIALRSGKPIIPIVLDGTYHLFKRTHILIGEPIDLRKYNLPSNPNEEQINSVNDSIYQKMINLKKDLDQRIEGHK